MPSTLKVVLQQNLPHLGKSGDVVKVRPGFARNYLVPQQLAVLATESTLRRIQHEQGVALAREEKRKKEARVFASKIASFPLRIVGKVGLDGKLFGSVTSKDIEAALLAEGIVLDRKQIHLSEPIRTIGSYQVIVKLHTEVESTLSLEVVA